MSRRRGYSKSAGWRGTGWRRTGAWRRRKGPEDGGGGVLTLVLPSRGRIIRKIALPPRILMKCCPVNRVMRREGDCNEKRSTRRFSEEIGERLKGRGIGRG